MTLTIPDLSLVVLIGPSGCGKSTFARKHFRPTEVLSSDFCRGLVSDDENDQAATKEAFEVLHFIASKRLAAGKLTVIDATNVQAEARKPLVALARQFHVPPVAIALHLPERVCADRNKLRPDRTFGPHVVRNQCQDLRRSLRNLEREGFRHVHILRTPEEVESAAIERQPLWNNRKYDHGPFDIIGDVHGCLDELLDLLSRPGYEVAEQSGEYRVAPPAGRKAGFVGDLVDRGPNVPGVLRLVMSMVEAVAALESAASLNPETSGLATECKERLDMTTRYIEAYRRYCWPVKSLDDLRLAPFHLLASEGVPRGQGSPLAHGDSRPYLPGRPGVPHGHSLPEGGSLRSRQ